MTPERGLHISECWFRLLLRLYPADFRDEMGESLVETYVDRAREARTRGASFVTVWFAALRDSLLNGVGERIRPAVSWKRGGDWGRDIQTVGRRFRRAPLFFVSTIATLTIGLGAFAVVYTAVDKILIEPLPYQDPDDLYMVWRAVADIDSTGVAGAEVVGLQNAGGSIEDAAGLRIGPLTLRASLGTDALRVTGMGSSPNLFDLLGVEPALGRGFQPDDIAPDAPIVVVLTDGLWKRFGGNDAIIGTEIRIMATPVTVIGVMPPGFQFNGSWTSQKPELYYPLRINPAERPFDDNFLALIRARRGAPREVIEHAVDAVGHFVAGCDGSDSGRTLHPVEFKADLISDIRPALIALGFAGGFLVLVLAVNLASLLLASAAEREREFAVSRALGASGPAVARATLAEGGLLGLIGGVAGAVAGAWGTRLLVALAPLDLPRLKAVALESDVAVVVIAGGVLLGLVAAAVPATWSLRVGLASLVAASAVRGGGSSLRAMRGLIVTQVALSLVLLSTGGLVVRSFERLLAADPGFEPRDVLTFAVSLGDWLFPEHADSYGFQDRVDAALLALPRVTGVSGTTNLPLSGTANYLPIRFPGAPGNTGDPELDRPLINRIFTRAGYVQAIGMRLLAGRGFGQIHPQDVREVLIDDDLAAQFFPDTSPIGATVVVDDEPLTIIGVVEQARLYELHRDGRPQIFVRAEDYVNSGRRPWAYVVRTDRDAQSLIPEVRTVIRQIVPGCRFQPSRPWTRLSPTAGARSASVLS